MKTVECVPNFSEGRDRSKIGEITSAIESVEGVTLLDVDPGEGANRTVVTFVGVPAAVEEAAFRGIEAASRVIDMRKHAGSHPRIGATDVCPFVPVGGVTMEECVEIARRLGRRVGDDLGIPVYLYEAAATSAARRNLADIRAGEYEGLTAKLRDPAWRPDFGPAALNRSAGATVIGARKFLVAYNVNLDSDRIEAARAIALEIREKGKLARDERGEKIPDGKGGWRRIPGMLRECKAVGWVIPEYGRAQVSINLTDHEITGMHDAFEAADSVARKVGVRVTGSEVVGLVPLDAVLASGRHFLAGRGECRGIPERAVVDAAVRSLGLREVAPFDPGRKIVEYRLSSPGNLVSKDLEAFTAEVSMDTPAPGGGSVAALAGALGAALASMVANLTFAKKGFESSRAAMEGIAIEAQGLRSRLLEAVDRDAAAFDLVLGAVRMPRGTDAERSARAIAVEEATKGAARVPLEVMEMGVDVLDLAWKAVEAGNPGSVTDGGVGGLVGLACVVGAHWNVLTNLKGIHEASFVTETRAAAAALRARAEETGARIRDRLDEKLG